MDVAQLLAVSPTYNQYDVSSLREEVNRLRRVLAATVRSYTALKKDCDAVKEESGYYRSSVRFLDFSREVRDVIYRYCLVMSHVNTEPRPRAWLNFDYRQMKPDTSNVCLVNKQVYRESTAILFFKNTFRFERPSHLFYSEERIGESKLDLVRRIEIVIIAHLEGDLTTPSDYQPIPSHWASTLNSSKLNHLVDIIVVNYHNWRFPPIQAVPPCLRIGAIGVLARNEYQSLTP